MRQHGCSVIITLRCHKQAQSTNWITYLISDNSETPEPKSRSQTLDVLCCHLQNLHLEPYINFFAFFCGAICSDFDKFAYHGAGNLVCSDSGGGRLPSLRNLKVFVIGTFCVEESLVRKEIISSIFLPAVLRQELNCVLRSVQTFDEIVWIRKSN